MAAQLCQNQHRKRRKERLQVVVFSPDLGFIHILVRYHNLSYTFHEIQKHSFIFYFFFYNESFQQAFQLKSVE